jgi:hypothetical protein
MAVLRIQSFTRRLAMSPTAKFHGTISTFTVGTVYWIMLHVSTILPPVDRLALWQKAVVAYATSVAVYNLAASGLRWFLGRSRLSRQLFLGAIYLEGTWVGCYETPSKEKRLTVEHFEQTLEGLTIRGAAYTETSNAEIVQWISKATSINETDGTLTYSYACTHRAPSLSQFEGLANFYFTRTDATRPPEILDGYSADLIDGISSGNHEVLLTRKLKNFREAWEDAKKMKLCS